MLAFRTANWLGLGNEIPSILRIIIRPTVYFRDLAGPVTMPRTDRCGPFQGCGLPGILGNHFPSLKYRIEKVEYEQKLNGKYYHGYRRNESVQVPELVKRKPVAI